jgi:hypothetical protein
MKLRCITIDLVIMRFHYCRNIKNVHPVYKTVLNVKDKNAQSAKQNIYLKMVNVRPVVRI